VIDLELDDYSLTSFHQPVRASNHSEPVQPGKRAAAWRPAPDDDIYFRIDNGEMEQIFPWTSLYGKHNASTGGCHKASYPGTFSQSPVRSSVSRQRYMCSGRSLCCRSLSARCLYL